MVIAGTHDEILYLKLQCQKAKCETCVLGHFCLRGMKKYKTLSPKELKTLEDGKLESILISKGDDKTEI